jgi:hypothetical protein
MAHERAGSDPAKWRQYKKALTVLGIGLLAALGDLGYAMVDGLTGPEVVHVLFVFVGTCLSAGGAAAVGNDYTVEQLQAKLAAAGGRR